MERTAERDDTRPVKQSGDYVRNGVSCEVCSVEREPQQSIVHGDCLVRFT